MKKLILFGAGGHSKVVHDVVNASNEYDLYAVIDDAFMEIARSKGVIYAPMSFLSGLEPAEFEFFIAIGDNHIRKKVFERLEREIDNYATLIHPNAVVSCSAQIGKGTVVMPNAVINADTVLGDNCIVNSGAVIEHDNIIGDYAHISPGATLAGGVNVGEGVHIGSGATVIPQVTIGDWSVIGAGGVVVNGIQDHVTAVGVPAKVINSSEKR